MPQLRGHRIEPSRPDVFTIVDQVPRIDLDVAGAQTIVWRVYYTTPYVSAGFVDILEPSYSPAEVARIVGERARTAYDIAHQEHEPG